MTPAYRKTTEGKGLAIAERFRRNLHRGSAIAGAWSTVPHPNVIEIMARLDFDFLLLDGEHSAMSPDDLGSLLPAAELYGMATVFRPRSQLTPAIKGALDAGVSGIMVPMIESAEEARTVVDLSRYAPAGKRGIGPWRASGFYDDFDAYLARANEAVTVVLQIESAAGLGQVDEIAAVDGYDALYVGPADLASSLGLPVGDRSETMMAALARVAQAARENGRKAGIDVQSSAEIPGLIQLGFSFFTIGSDMGFLQTAGRRLTAEITPHLVAADPGRAMA